MGLSTGASGMFGGMGLSFTHTPAVTGIIVSFSRPSSGYFVSATPSATGTPGFGNYFAGNLPGSIAVAEGFPTNYFPSLTLPATSVFTTSGSGFSGNRPLNSS